MGRRKKLNAVSGSIRILVSVEKTQLSVRQSVLWILTLATRGVQHGVTRAQEVVYEQTEALGRYV